MWLKSIFFEMLNPFVVCEWVLGCQKRKERLGSKPKSFKHLTLPGDGYDFHFLGQMVKS
jgi:hypothetical protein